MDSECCLRPPRCFGLQRSVWPHPRCQHSPSYYRLQSVTCLLEVLSLPPADENSNNIHNSFWLFCVPLLLSLLYPSLQSHHRVVSLSLPQTDRAVQLLLETSADNPSYYCDSLKACLVTTITSSGPSQSTIKLVATNMIANGKLAGSICVCSLKSTLKSSFCSFDL